MIEELMHQRKREWKEKGGQQNMLREYQSIIMYLNGNVLSSFEGGGALLVNAYLTPDKRYEMVGFDRSGYLYTTNEMGEQGLHTVVTKQEGEEALHYIFKELKSLSTDLYYAIEENDPSTLDMNQQKEHILFAATAYLNAYLRNAYLLTLVEAPIEPLQAEQTASILDLLETLSTLFRLTKTPILSEQKLYNQYHVEHFILLTVYKILVRAYGIDRIGHIVWLDERKHQNQTKTLHVIGQTIAHHDKKKGNQKNVAYYQNRLEEMKAEYSKQ